MGCTCPADRILSGPPREVRLWGRRFPAVLVFILPPRFHPPPLPSLAHAAGPHGVPKKKRPLPVAAARSPAPLLDFQPRRRPWGSGRGPIHVFYLPPELQEDLSVRRRVQLVRNHVPYNASFDYVMDTDLEGASDLFLGNRSI
mmetsp:Transcript_21606/g.49121  ORF Transcript_21606/g.49121 Transcript_21606/m.49121 type:complete len:143 (-) Transcript_21606:297-725(-)